MNTYFSKKPIRTKISSIEKLLKSDPHQNFNNYLIREKCLISGPDYFSWKKNLL